MPIEYYLAAGVALIVLLLLVFALAGKKSKRVIVPRNPGMDELTKQVARATDALEALLAHLKAFPPQAAIPIAQAPRPLSSATVEQSTMGTAEVAPEIAKPQPASEPPAIPEMASEPAVSKPVTAEPVVGEEEAPVEQKRHRVKLSMFGR